MSDKNISADLEARLGYKKINFYEKGDEAAIKAAYDYAPGYMAYLDAAKTEREAVTVSIAMAEKEGYVPYTFGMPLTAGGKYYYNNRGRNLFLFRVGSEPIRVSASWPPTWTCPASTSSSAPSTRTAVWPSSRPTTTAASASTSG